MSVTRDLFIWACHVELPAATGLYPGRPLGELALSGDEAALIYLQYAAVHHPVPRVRCAARIIVDAVEVAAEPGELDEHLAAYPRALAAEQGDCR